MLQHEAVQPEYQEQIPPDIGPETETRPTQVTLSIPVVEEVRTPEGTTYERLCARFVKDSYIATNGRGGPPPVSIHIADLTVVTTVAGMRHILYKNRLFFNKETKRLNLLWAREYFKTREGRGGSKVLHRISMPSTESNEDLRTQLLHLACKALNKLSKCDTLTVEGKVIRPNSGAQIAVALWRTINRRYTVESMLAPL